MYYFDPSFHRRQPDNFAGQPLGLSPDGHWIMEVKDLPVLPIPKQVDMTRDRLRIDGWVFPMNHVSRGFLEWLRASFIQWTEDDKSIRNREWVRSIAEVFQNGLKWG